MINNYMPEKIDLNVKVVNGLSSKWWMIKTNNGEYYPRLFDNKDSARWAVCGDEMRIVCVNIHEVK